MISSDQAKSMASAVAQRAEPNYQIGSHDRFARSSNYDGRPEGISMNYTLLDSLEALAGHVGRDVETVWVGGEVWQSAARLYEADGFRELEINVRETPLSCLDLGHCKLLDSYFPVVDGAVLFHKMHHNGDLRAERYLDDNGQLSPRQKKRLEETTQCLADGPQYFLLAGDTDNLWHYFYNFLLRLAVVKGRFGSVEQSPYTFLLPDGLKPDFYSFAEIVGIPRDRWQLFDPSQPLALPNLTITQIPVYLEAGHVHVSRAACDAMRLPAKPTDGASPPRRIYLSRADARWRRVLNEDEFVPELEKRGFHSVQLTNLDAQEMVDMMAQAECVIGPSGANLGATMFCPEGCNVIEFSDMPMIGKYYFQITSNAHGMTHHKLLATAEKSEENYHRWHVSVPTVRLLEIVDSIFA